MMDLPFLLFGRVGTRPPKVGPKTSWQVLRRPRLEVLAIWGVACEIPDTVVPTLRGVTIPKRPVRPRLTRLAFGVAYRLLVIGHFYSTIATLASTHSVRFLTGVTSPPCNGVLLSPYPA